MKNHQPLFWHTDSVSGGGVFDLASISFMLNYFQGENFRYKFYCPPYLETIMVFYDHFLFVKGKK